MKGFSSSSEKLYSFDVRKNKKLKFYVNLASALVGIAMFAVGCLIVPFKEIYNVPNLNKFMLRAGVLVLCMAASLALHELIHIIATKVLTGHSARTGFDKFYPYVGNKGSVGKAEYILISLSPFVIIGAILLGLLFAVPRGIFWLVYITFILHITGSVGDLYCAFKIMSERNGIRIKDNGKAVEIWLK